MHDVVDQHWAEVAAVVPLIEELSEDELFPARELAAAVASKCFFHLEEYSDALRLALGAGKYFDVSAKTEYVSTMVSKCIDQYTAQRTAAVGVVDEELEEEEMDPRMEGIVERMFERCYADGEYTQAMGIALEARRLDKVKETIQQATDKASLLKYTFDVCQTLVSSRETRLQVLRILVAMYRLQAEPDYVAVCKCYQFLGEVRTAMQQSLPIITSYFIVRIVYFDSRWPTNDEVATLVTTSALEPRCNVMLPNRKFLSPLSFLTLSGTVFSLHSVSFRESCR